MKKINKKTRELSKAVETAVSIIAHNNEEEAMKKLGQLSRRERRLIKKFTNKKSAKENPQSGNTN